MSETAPKTSIQPADRSPFDEDDGGENDPVVFTKPIEEDLPEDVSPAATPYSSSSKEVYRDPVPKSYKAQREALKKKFPEGWNPPKKLSRTQMDDLRLLRHQDPARFNTAALAERYKISPEAVRRILKSKWQPSAERLEEKLSIEQAEKERQSAYWARKREQRKGRRPALEAFRPKPVVLAEPKTFGRGRRQQQRERKDDDDEFYFR